MSKKIMKIWLVGLALFAIYFLCANSIMLAILPVKNKAKAVDFAKFPEATASAYAGLNSVQVRGNSDENLYADGFIIPKDKSALTQISLVFKGDNACYETFPLAQPIYQRNVGELFTQLGCAADDENGFDFEVSTINFKNGHYDIFVFCKSENGDILIPLNRGILKQSKMLRQYDNAFLAENLGATNCEQADYILDNLALDNDAVKFFGSAYILGENAEKQEVFAEIKLDGKVLQTYRVSSSANLVAAEKYKSLDALNTSFCASIPVKDLPQEGASLVIVVKSGDKIYRSTEHKLILK